MTINEGATGLDAPCPPLDVVIAATGLAFTVAHGSTIGNGCPYSADDQAHPILNLNLLKDPVEEVTEPYEYLGGVTLRYEPVTGFESALYLARETQLVGPMLSIAMPTTMTDIPAVAADLRAGEASSGQDLSPLAPAIAQLLTDYFLDPTEGLDPTYGATGAAPSGDDQVATIIGDIGDRTLITCDGLMTWHAGTYCSDGQQAIFDHVVIGNPIGFDDFVHSDVAVVLDTEDPLLLSLFGFRACEEFFVGAGFDSFEAWMVDADLGYVSSARDIYDLAVDRLCPVP